MPLPRSHAVENAVRHLLRWLRIAAAGYLVVGVFVVALLVLAGRWSTLSHAEMLILAGVAAAPLALAFLWHRIERVKFYNLEVYLNRATRQVSATVSDLKDAKIMPAGASFEKVMTKQIRTAIHDEGLELLRVDLEKEPRWWSTRLFLLAALAEDYTKVRQLIFVTPDKTEQCSFVGMATPKSVRHAYATKHRFIEKAYASYDKWDVRGKISAEEEAGWVIGKFGREIKDQGMDEERIKEVVTPNGLRNELRDNLVTGGVQWPRHPLVTPLLIYRIVDFSEPYVALLNDRHLLRVVDRGAIATQLSREALEQELQ
jgi:hypothetical protein